MAKKSKKKRIQGNEDDAGFGHNPFASALNLTPPAPVEKAVKSTGTGTGDFAWGGVEKVVLRREKKGRGGKTVTLVQGISMNVDQSSAFTKELKRSLGVGVTLEGDDFVVQGDQRDRIEALLKKKRVSKIVHSG